MVGLKEGLQEMCHRIASLLIVNVDGHESKIKDVVQCEAVGQKSLSQLVQHSVAQGEEIINSERIVGEASRVEQLERGKCHSLENNQSS